MPNQLQTTESAPTGKSHRLAQLAVIGLISLIGCEKSGDQANSNPQPAVGAAQRIVVLAPNAAELICAIGGCDRLVGVSSYCLYPPEVATLTKIGGLTDTDLEAFLSLKPDLAILRGQGGAVRQLCADRGIAIYDDQVETLSDIYRTTRDLGRLLGQTVEADALVADIQRSLAEVQRSVADREPVRVLPVIMRDRAGLKNILSCGKNTFLTELIEIAGGRNIFGEMIIDYPSVSLEEIIGRGPEVIVEMIPGQEMSDQEQAELIKPWVTFDSIPAVRAKRIHVLTEPFVTIPSDRVVQTAWLLRSLFHPELDDE